MAPIQKHLHRLPREHDIRRGHTLVELIVSMGSATILMCGLASALLISSRALSLDSDSQAKRQQSAEIQADLMADLQYVLSFSERTANAVTFTVPDRDGDSNPETIRYAWSGTAGDPLTYEYNGGTAVTLAADVQKFDMSYLTRTMQPDAQGINVLLVVPNAFFMGYGDIQRKSLLESWGHTVTLIDDSDSQANFNTAAAANDVAYVASTIIDSELSIKLKNVVIGVVIEHRHSASDFGLVSDHFDANSGTSLVIEDNSHFITEEFALGTLQILTTSDQLHSKDDDLASGLVGLGSRTGAPDYVELAVIDQGGSLWGGGGAAGRRVQLPWGDAQFSVDTLTADGLTILQRALVWAGGLESGASPSFPVFEEFTEAKETSGDDRIDINIPPGNSQGDLLIAAVATDGNTKNEIAPEESGWTLIGVEQRYDAVTFAVWWKIAGASEPSEYRFRWQDGPDEQAYGWIMRFTGHDPINPINVSALVTQGSGVGDPPSPEVTTTVDNTLILRLGGFDDDDVTTDVPGLSGHTAITMDSSNSGTGTTSGGAGYATQTTAGASGSSTFSLLDQEQSVSITIAIAPAP